MSISPQDPWAYREPDQQPLTQAINKKGFEYWLSVASFIALGSNVVIFMIFASISLGPQAYVYNDIMRPLVLLLLVGNVALISANFINGIVILAQRRSLAMALLRFAGAAVLLFTGFWAMFTASMATWTF